MQGPFHLSNMNLILDHYILCFFLSADLGKEVKKKKVVVDLEPRFGHTSHVIANSLLLVGGVGPFGPLGKIIYRRRYVDCRLRF